MSSERLYFVGSGCDGTLRAGLALTGYGYLLRGRKYRVYHLVWGQETEFLGTFDTVLEAQEFLITTYNLRGGQ